MNDSKIKKYATHLIHKLTTKMTQEQLTMFSNSLPTIQCQSTDSTTSSLSDEDEVHTPTDSMVLLNSTLESSQHHTTKSVSSTISTFDSHGGELVQTYTFNSTAELYDYYDFERKESKAIAMWQSTVQKLIIQKRIVKSMEHYIKKTKYTERDETLSRFILNELQSTEKSFYQFLLYIHESYMEPMLMASQTKNGLVKGNEVRVLFKYLPELINASRKLLYRLERIQDRSPGLVIGNAFKEMEPEFVVFLKYAIHYQANLKLIQKASTCGVITKISNESRNKRHEHSRLGISDYLIAPFQRVPRYELLLKDLLKHTEINKNEDESLIYANNLIRGLAATMNDVQEKIIFLSALP